MTDQFHPGDTNKNGVLEPSEIQALDLEDRRRRLLDEDAHRDQLREMEREDRSAQRKMAFFALAGLLLYPSGIFLCDLLGLPKAAELIADIAPTYFASIAVLCSAFFGASAIKDKVKKS